MKYFARAVVLDIEGTIGDISFVKNVMFPITRNSMPEYVADPQANGIADEVHEVKTLLASELKKSIAVITNEEITEYLVHCIDTDKKYAPLKSIQGKIWAKSFVSGKLESHLYPDVFHALKRFSEADLLLAVYSSGSITAQKLYFKFSQAGDLTKLIRAWFDTRSGSKKEASSYQRIANDLGLPAQEILFFTDNHEELKAAKKAGWQVAQLLRDLVVPAESFDQHATLDFVQIGLPGENNEH
jgi:enolase-phosphatase E1